VCESKTPPEQRLQEQDTDGMDAEVLFPAQAAGPALWRNITHDKVYKHIVRGYNDWLGELNVTSPSISKAITI
jgi:hypothetical protein